MVVILPNGKVTGKASLKYHHGTMFPFGLIFKKVQFNPYAPKINEFENVVYLRRMLLYIYLKPKVTLHCYYLCLFWALVCGILNVFNSY